MALINPFVKSAWNKLVLACTIANIVGYIIMVRGS